MADGRETSCRFCEPFYSGLYVINLVTLNLAITGSTNKSLCPFSSPEFNNKIISFIRIISLLPRERSVVGKSPVCPSSRLWPPVTRAALARAAFHGWRPLPRSAATEPRPFLSLLLRPVPLFSGDITLLC